MAHPSSPGASLEARLALAKLAPGKLMRAADLVGGGRTQARDFELLRAAAAGAALTEIAPEAPGEEAAVLGFALAWVLAAKPLGLIVCAAVEAALAETGFLQAQGLAQFGVDLGGLVVARARAQDDALWAAEQALGAPQAMVLALVGPAKRPLSLPAARRLALAAQRRGTRCVLVRFDPLDLSPASSRWMVRAAASQGAGRELGAPAFAARLARNRAGPSGFSWRLEWRAHEQRFYERAGLDGALPARFGDCAPGDRRQSTA